MLYKSLLASGFLLLAPCISNSFASSLDVSTLVEGKTVVLEDGRVTYAPDGRYTFRSDKTIEQGRYSLSGDKVHIRWPSGMVSTERYVEQNGSYYRINKVGKRSRVESIR